MKKIFFVLAFMLIGSASFASNLLEKEIEISETNITEIELDDFGNCSFTYTLTAVNSVTGESFSQTFSHSIDAVSDLDCRLSARAYVRSHAVNLQNSLNN